ncbi:hypothetical protein PIB30_061355 [Stylosanthes scabra]|uniref:Uncharacterized protein n=1 Tax=Stylosanthes scabra TaxID=79078 RepID=A0ABU6SKU9_9FABA|nr:hypothetical protein [Stylosanthes scabra]
MSSSSPTPLAVDGSVEGLQHLQFVVAVLGNGGLDPAATAAASPAPSPASSQRHPQPLLSLSLLYLTASLSVSHTKPPSRWRRCASIENLRACVTLWSHLPPFIIIRRGKTYDNLRNQ